MSLRRWLLVVGVMVLTACITESRGLLFLTVDADPPDSTRFLSIPIAGRVIRSPPMQGVSITVLVTGGAEPADTVADDFGGFRLSVLLRAAQENVLLLSADDGTGSLSDQLEFIVVQVEPMPELIYPRSQR